MSPSPRSCRRYPALREAAPPAATSPAPRRIPRACAGHHRRASLTNLGAPSFAAPPADDSTPCAHRALAQPRLVLQPITHALRAPSPGALPGRSPGRRAQGRRRRPVRQRRSRHVRCVTRAARNGAVLFLGTVIAMSTAIALSHTLRRVPFRASCGQNRPPASHRALHFSVHLPSVSRPACPMTSGWQQRKVPASASSTNRRHVNARATARRLNHPTTAPSPALPTHPTTTRFYGVMGLHLPAPPSSTPTPACATPSPSQEGKGGERERSPPEKGPPPPPPPPPPNSPSPPPPPPTPSFPPPPRPPPAPPPPPPEPPPTPPRPPPPGEKESAPQRPRDKEFLPPPLRGGPPQTPPPPPGARHPPGGRWGPPPHPTPAEGGERRMGGPPTLAPAPTFRPVPCGRRLTPPPPEEPPRPPPLPPSRPPASPHVTPLPTAPDTRPARDPPPPPTPQSNKKEKKNPASAPPTGHPPTPPGARGKGPTAAAHAAVRSPSRRRIPRPSADSSTNAPSQRHRRPARHREQHHHPSTSFASRPRRRIVIDWIYFDRLSDIVPLLAQSYPQRQCDLHQFHPAGLAIGFLMRRVAPEGLLHADVNTVDCPASALHPRCLPLRLRTAWRPSASFSMAPAILADAEASRQRDVASNSSTGNLGRAVIKAPPCKPRAPASSNQASSSIQEPFPRRLQARRTARDFIAVFRLQSPRARQAELHKLTPPRLGVRQRPRLQKSPSHRRPLSLLRQSPRRHPRHPECLTRPPRKRRSGDVLSPRRHRRHPGSPLDAENCSAASSHPPLGHNSYGMCPNSSRARAMASGAEHAASSHRRHSGARVPCDAVPFCAPFRRGERYRFWLLPRCCKPTPRTPPRSPRVNLVSDLYRGQAAGFSAGPSPHPVYGSGHFEANVFAQ